MNRPSTRPEDLLAAYRTGRSFFASHSGTLLTDGVRAELPACGGGDGAATLPRRVDELLRATPRASGEVIAVGAIPFDHDRPAYLTVPEAVRRSGRPPVAAEPPVAPEATSGWRFAPEPDQRGYAAAVADAVGRFATSPLEKVVLGRTAMLTAPRPVDVAALVAALAGLDPTGYTFAVEMPLAWAGRRGQFVGATPELVVSRSGDRVLAYPHAGSARRSPDPALDRERGERLAASPKDRHEHAVVIDDIVRVLRPFCRTLTVPPGPELVSTRAMWHLATRVEGVLADPATTSLDLACALHPTPAVGGKPTGLARAVIGELEPFDRNCFGGMVGWTDAAGDGEWVLALRSAEVCGDRLRLFAGAGIVPGSVPDAEVAETAAKFRTMLDALGVADEL
ncbi:MAG: isochorismate synthase [Streptosporangiales bacterium]|nr:isochorismate synthase [Streptosporangiales bacterium]MBO0889525.1 isochorismate synthase [Acidothermales bacterium]